MNKIKCVVTDDEPLARDILENYISNLDYLELCGRCSNAIETINFLQKNKIDLLFLDIQMPKLTGIDLLKTLRHPPQVILTTAYRDYALEGYDLNILDYLLKPISFERFVIAVNKFHNINQFESLAVNTNNEQDERFIYLKAEKKMIKIFLKDILYIESLKDYVRVKTTSLEIVTYQKISYLEEKLPDDKFIRIHRSYIIAIDKIDSFTASTVEIDSKEIPIGRLYKNPVMIALGINKI